MDVAKGLLIVLLALVVAYLPFPLGGYFGYGAVVVTPVVLLVLLVGLGVLIGKTMPARRWLWSGVATIVIATAYTVTLRIGMTLDPQRLTLETFVIVPAVEGPAFTSKLAKLLKDQGIEATLSHWSYDDEDMHYNLFATKGLVEIFSHNVEMSGFEGGFPSGRCLPAGAEPRPDPGQYIITISAGQPCADKAVTRRIYDDVKQSLATHGFELRDKPALCSAVAHEPATGR